MKKVAVVLCGSGFKDGSEIRESVGVLWALSEEGVDARCFAPNQDQIDVVNTLNDQSMPEKRNMLIEAARIARGEIQPIETLQPSEFDAIFFPGGFGVAKNLCTFAMEGSSGTVHDQAKRVIEEAHRLGKPIGAICISPALVAMALPEKKLELIVGDQSEASQEIEKLGHTHRVCSAHDCVVDRKNKVVTTPAYMFDNGSLKDIFPGDSKSAWGETMRLT